MNLNSKNGLISSLWPETQKIYFDNEYHITNEAHTKHQNLFFSFKGTLMMDKGQGMVILLVSSVIVTFFLLTTGRLMFSTFIFSFAKSLNFQILKEIEIILLTFLMRLRLMKSDPTISNYDIQTHDQNNIFKINSIININ